MPNLKQNPFTKYVATLFLVALLFTFNLCGMGPFSQSFHMYPHHSSKSTSPDCEQVCFSKNVSYQNLAPGSLEFKPFQSGLRSGVLLALISEVSTSFGVLDRLTLPRGSTKLYKILSTYRI